MIKFEFTGNWSPEITLPEFGKLNDKELRGYRQNKTSLDLFGIQIEDYNDNNPNPLKTQTNAIEFVLNHEIQILNNVYHYIKDVVYPQYMEFMPKEDYPESYPTLNSPEDLKKLLGLNEVIIYLISKDDFSYMVFSFNSWLDYEHGLCITMHKDRCVDWAEMGNLDQDKIAEEKGEVVIDSDFEDSQEKVNGLFLPHAQYGVLKPWQLEVNKDLPSNLLYDDDIDGLKKYYASYPEIAVSNAEHLVQRALWWNKSMDTVSYLLSISAKCPFTAMEIAVERKDLVLIKFLFDKGFDINTKSIGDGKITDTVIRTYLKEKNESNKTLMNYFLKKGGKLENTDPIFDINERQLGNDRQSTLDLIKYLRSKETNVSNGNWVKRFFGK